MSVIKLSKMKDFRDKLQLWHGNIEARVEYVDVDGIIQMKNCFKNSKLSSKFVIFFDFTGITDSIRIQKQGSNVNKM